MFMMASIRQLILVAGSLVATVTAQYGEIPLPAGLSPRFYLGPSKQLPKRQSGLCAANSHSCLDVNSTTCCPDSKYCIVDSDYSAKCCDIGSECGNPCASSLYQCPTTTTVQGKSTVVPACCARGCSQGAFKCASSLGGGCCEYGSTCGAGGECKSTVQSTTSSAILSVIPSGCTTSQIACATSLGGGCCDNGFGCTVIDNSFYCARASETAVRTGHDGVLATGEAESGNQGLSTGAKAGIGVGISIGACLVLALLLYFCVVHRRLEKLESQRAASVPAMSQESSTGYISKRPLVAGRQPSDYFGPTATPGPFTEDVSSPASSGVTRGVPATPQSPGDIQVPVEIDSRSHSNVTSPGNFAFNVTPPGSLKDLKQGEVLERAIELP